MDMAKKGVKLGVASAVAIGAGAAMMAKKVKNSNTDEKNKTTEKKQMEKQRLIRSTAIQSAGNMKRTVRESITAMEIMRHLPARKNRRAWTKRTPTS